MRSWAGIDVGGVRKGFHLAVIDARGLVAEPVNVKSVAAAVNLITEFDPLVIGIDCPRFPAPLGARSRECERDLARAVCGIRYTPDSPTIDRGGPYYEWIRHGFALYDALVAAGRSWRVLEVFPTASLTRLHQPRAKAPRTAWSRQGLTKLNLAGVGDRRLSQDDRDAIVAAVTARLCSRADRIEWFGEIAVPT